MFNPSASSSSDTSELEREAIAMFGELSREELPQVAAEEIRESILAALTNTRGTAATHRGFAFAGALAAPLLIAGAASAATVHSPLEAPAAVFEAAASVGLRGHSADIPDDLDLPGETAGNAGQPGSPPGSTANAPAPQGIGQADAAADEGTCQPGAQPLANEPNSEPRASGAASQPAANEPGSGPSSSVSVNDGEVNLPPHENGKGCDDVLFAEREPPFASPGGPVGCEAGNSADHRQNGMPEDDDDAPDPVGELAVEPRDEPEVEKGEGGTSHGLGHGHEEDGPGNGNGNVHANHGHDPNPNGHGPGGPGDEDLDDGGSPAQSDGSALDDSATASAGGGKSAEAKGKNKDN